MCQILYIPGLSDDNYGIQSILSKSWRFYGFQGVCHVFPWSGTELYQTKMDRLIATIDTLSKDGRSITLIGASAGASAALIAFDLRSSVISNVLLVCPKINRPDNVGEERYRRNPAYRTAMVHLQAVVNALTIEQKQRIATFYSPRDGVVSYEDTVIAGVKQYALPKFIHPVAILYALSFGFGRLRRAINLLNCE